MDLLEIIDNWISSRSQLDQNDRLSVFSLLKTTKITNIVRFRTSHNHLHIDNISADINQKVILFLENVDNLSKIMLWMEHTDEEEFDIDQVRFQVLDQEKDQYGNKIGIIGNCSNSELSIDQIKHLTKLANHIISQNIKIQSLESSLQIAYASLSNTSQTIERLVLDRSEVPEKFSNDAVPTVWYGVAHEMIGPTFIVTIPEFINVAENMDKIVNVFSTMDSNMIAEVGHVFSTNPVKSPFMGEVISIVFTVANDSARGKYELHAVSAVISQQFMNMAKTIHIDLTSILFSAAEGIRSNLDMTQVKIATTDLDELQRLTDSAKLSFVPPILDSVKFEIARSLATLIDKRELIKWE